MPVFATIHSGVVPGRVVAQSSSFGEIKRTNAPLRELLGVAERDIA